MADDLTRRERKSSKNKNRNKKKKKRSSTGNRRSESIKTDFNHKASRDRWDHNGRPSHETDHVSGPNFGVYEQTVGMAQCFTVGGFPFHEYPDSPMVSNDDLWQRMNQLEQECNFLRGENERLKSALFNIQIVNPPPTDFPVVNITFRNHDLAGQYLPEIERFLLHLLSQGQNDNANNADETANDLADMFVVDSQASNVDLNCDKLPLYDKNVDNVLGDEGKKSSQRFRVTCFNCCGDHSLSQCTEELNHQLIAQRRSERMSYASPSTRYHVQDESFEAFKPGIIGNDLRDALQLRENQIPSYIYRMRLLGYPPGWLEEASVESSGLALYGKEQPQDETHKNEKDNVSVHYDPKKLIDFPGFNVPLCPDFIDESKKLGYPPFQPGQLRAVMEQSLPKEEDVKSRKRKHEEMNNASVPKAPRLDEDMDLDVDSDDGFTLIDECGSPAVPPTDLGNFIPPLPPPDDFEGFAPPLPDESTNFIPPPPPPDDSESMPPPLPEDSESSLPPPPLPEDSQNFTTPPQPTSPTSTPVPEFEDDSCSKEAKFFASLTQNAKVYDNDDDACGSPSLKELEEQKKLLMMALNADVSDSSELPDGANTPTDRESTLPETTNSDVLETSQKSSSSGSQISLTLGSPSFPTFSSCTKLPDSTKFKEGIQGQLLFENLPDSTGSFERVKNILKKVRESLNS